MDNLVDSYLLFKADNVSKYVEELNKFSPTSIELPVKLRDIVYDYLNEVLLGNDILDKEKLVEITNMHVDNITNSIFKLLVEYGVTTRKALKTRETADTYRFIVDAIMLFACVDGMTNTSKCGDVSFDSTFNKAYHKLNLQNEKAIKKVINAHPKGFVNIFKTSLSKNDEFNRVLANQTYIFNQTNIDATSLLIDFEYINDDLFSYEAKEIDFVRKDFNPEIFKNSMDLCCLNVIEDILKGDRKRLFIKIPSYILMKKSLVKVLTDCTRIFAVKRNIILLVNYSQLEDVEGLADTLTDSGYTMAINKDREFGKMFNLYGVKYLFLEYSDDSEFKNIIRKCSDTVEMFITNRIQKRDRLKCLEFGITHFVKSR